MQISNILTQMRHQVMMQERLLGKATEHISTGYRINEASDSPGDILRISRLESNLRANTVAQRNTQDAISFVQTGDAVLGSVQEMAQRMRELAVNYQNSTLSNSDKSIIEGESKSLSDEISKLMSNTKFNNQRIFGESKYTFNTSHDSGNLYVLQIPELPLPSSVMDVKSVDPKELNIPNQKGYTGYNDVYDKNGDLLYSGYLVDGKFEGYGIIYKNGNKVYEGGFVNGQYDGYGKTYYESGTLSYEGDFKNGKSDGWGKFYYENGSIMYEGDVKDGYRQGWGNTYDKTGNRESSTYGDAEVANKVLQMGKHLETLNTLEVSDLLNIELLDEVVLKGVSNMRSAFGIAENILERRLESSLNSETINTNHLSLIRDADIAKEVMEKVKAEMLISTNTMLMTKVIEQQRSYILQLLQS